MRSYCILCLFHSKDNPKQATRVRSSKYQICPDSIRPATVILMPACWIDGLDRNISFYMLETFILLHWDLTDFEVWTECVIHAPRWRARIYLAPPTKKQEKNDGNHFKSYYLKSYVAGTG